MPYKNPHAWMIVPALAAILGGVIGYVRELKATGSGFSWIEFTLHVFTAGFVGLCVAMATKEFYGVDLAGALAGVSGLFSKALVNNALRLGRGYLAKRWGVNLEQDKK